MQTLYVKQADGSTRPVHVHRSWLDISGRQIFLHHDGTYGDKAGVPIRDVAELSGLSPEHRRQALAWWERTGKALSESHCQSLAEHSQRIAGDFQEALAAASASTILDAVLYTRRQGKKGAVSAAKSWLDYGFTARPDWWGQATMIGFQDAVYEMLAPDDDRDSNP